ncbi:Protein Mon2-like [Manis pentadactyla]|nr:Protein Mon2-like [Manis pentadactyla]
MTGVAADGVVSETLALRKELGPGSDVTGRATWWIRIMVEVSDPCSIDRAGISYDAADGVVSETLALRKELGPGSDVTTGEQHGMDQDYGEAWVTSMFQTLQLMASFQGEFAIQFQDYSVAKVISMMRLEFQATGPR